MLNAKVIIKLTSNKLKFIFELIKSFVSTRPAARIKGIAIKNENFTALSRSIPLNIPEPMVRPLREKPGKIENIWKKLIKIESIKPISDFFCLLNLVE